MRPIILATLLATSLLGCIADNGVVDELAGDEADNGGKADDAELGTFFNVTFAANGSASANRVNRTTTRCPSGTSSTSRASCEIDGGVDWSRSGFDAAQQHKLDALLISNDPHHPVLMRGTLRQQEGSDGKTVIAPTEIWFGANAAEADDGDVFVMISVKPDAETCMAPCEPLVERKLNSTLAADITGVDTDSLNLNEIEGEQLVAETFGNGLIVAGRRYAFTNDGHSLRGRTATAAYSRLMPADFQP